MSIARLDNINNNGKRNFYFASIAGGIDQIAPDLRIAKLKTQRPFSSRVKSQTLKTKTLYADVLIQIYPLNLVRYHVSQGEKLS